MRADELRARILRHPEAWRAITRFQSHEYGPTIDNGRDDRRRPLSARDPRAVELELAELHGLFWSDKASAGELRLAARRCVVIARHLEARCTCHDEEGFRILADGAGALA